MRLSGIWLCSEADLSHVYSYVRCKDEGSAAKHDNADYSDPETKTLSFISKEVETLFVLKSPFLIVPSHSCVHMKHVCVLLQVNN